MNQGIIEEAALLANLTEGVLPKLRREKQFGAMFDRKKDDVVIARKDWNALNAMVRGTRLSHPRLSDTCQEIPHSSLKCQGHSLRATTGLASSRNT